MIKEIEVGGVKHSITLADDMIGSGLKRDADGAIGVFLSHGLKLSTGLDRTIEVDVSSLCGSGLVVDGRKLSVDISTLAGSGLVASGGKLNVVGGGGSVDAGSLAGSGLRSIEDNKLALALSESNLLKFGPENTLDINLPLLSGSGLRVDGLRLSINPGIAGSGLEYTTGGTMNIQVGSGLTYEYGGAHTPIYVKIAKRTSGLRLFFNSDGALDVTQD